MMEKRLVVYYSFSGVTRALALEIARQAGADTRELAPQRAYAFDHNSAAKAARAEVARGYCPVLARGNEPVDAYGTLLIGSPNWFASIAPPVLSFLRAHDFTGKAIVPFCTHGGGGFGGMEQAIARECPGALLRPGLAADRVDEAQIARWLQAAL